MSNLCIHELQQIVGGELKLGLMPPLAGILEPIRRMIVDSLEACPGDVFWALVGDGYDGACHAEEAFSKGALGVVASSRPIEPWAGKFVLIVPDVNQALTQLAAHQRLRCRGRCQPSARFQAGNTTSMLAALLRGGNVTANELIAQIARHPARVAV